MSNGLWYIRVVPVFMLWGAIIFNSTIVLGLTHTRFFSIDVLYNTIVPTQVDRIVL